MLLGIVQNWLTGGSGRIAAPRRAPAAPHAPRARLPVPPPAVLDGAAPPNLAWPGGRIRVAETLWGEGFLAPGGQAEITHLTRPMGLSEAASLLYVGAGTGGGVRGLASASGVWVTGFEVDAELAAIAKTRSQKSGLGRRADIALLDPRKPDFGAARFNHALALEPLRGHAAEDEKMLTAIAAAVKRNGQLTLVQLVAEGELDIHDPLVAAWLRLERRAPSLPTRLGITTSVRRLGFDVRVVEDISARHMDQTLQGWNGALQTMRDDPPTPAEARAIVAEAELWLLRQRLLRAGKIRLLRWYGIGKKGSHQLDTSRPEP